MRSITSPPRSPRDWSRGLQAFALLAPGTVLLGLLLVWPLAVMLDLSFRERFATGAAYTLSKYRDILGDPYFIAATLRTFALAAVTTAACAALGFPAAWFLARSRSRYKHLAFLAILFPLLVSIVVRTMGWTILLGTEGLVNSLLLGLGIIREPLRLMLSFWTVAVGLTHVLLPFMVLSLAAVLGKIDPSLPEAAQTLGAGPVRTFRRIILPLAIQGLASGSVIVFCLAIGAYLTPAWLGRGSVVVLSTLITEQMTVIVDWPAGSAGSMILIAATLLLLGGYGLFVAKAARR